MPDAPPITVMLVDPHAIMRDGLQALLERAGGYEVVGQAGDAGTAVALARRLTPDVIIMEAQLRTTSGTDPCRAIIEAAPETRVLVLTGSTAAHTVVEACAAGAAGYLTKQASVDTLLARIRDVVAGEFRIPSDLARRVFAALREPPSTPRTGDRLTAREQQLLTLYAEGRSYAQVADVESKSPHTVRNAMMHMRRKLGIKTNQELIVWAVRRGLLDDADPGD